MMSFDFGSCSRSDQKIEDEGMDEDEMKWNLRSACFVKKNKSRSQEQRKYITWDCLKNRCP